MLQPQRVSTIVIYYSRGFLLKQKAQFGQALVYTNNKKKKPTSVDSKEATFSMNLLFWDWEPDSLSLAQEGRRNPLIEWQSKKDS